MENRIKINIIFIFLFIIRVIYLDSDLPSLYISQIYHLDEGYYTIPAFNLYHYGEMSHQIFDYIPDDGSPANVFQNILTWIFLEVFGNTYYGLRFASVFISMIVLILFYLLAKQLLKHQEFKYKNHLILGTTIYLGIDFEFLLLSRVAEPTIFRIFSMMFLIYLFYLRDKNNKIDSKLWTFFIGLFATFSVFFVYFYNLFILAGCWLVIVLYFFINKEKKKAVIHTIIYGLGFILGVLLFELFLRVVYNQNLIEYFQSMQMYSSRLSYSNGFIGFIKNMFINLFNMFGTNIFRFNISFLFIFLFFIPIFIYKLKKEKKYFDFIVFSLVFMHILQVLFENSYFYRRLTILLPLILLIIILSADYFTIFIENFKNNKYFRGYFIFIILFSLIIFYVFNISNYGLGSLNSESFIKISFWIVIFNLIVYLIFNKLLYNFLIKKTVFVFGFYAIFIPNIFLNMNYIFLNPTYSFKNFMMLINKDDNCNISMGLLSFSTRLYNNLKPVLNRYKTEYELNDDLFKNNFNKLFEKNCVYLIDYDNTKKTVANLPEITSKKFTYIPVDYIFSEKDNFVLTSYIKVAINKEDNDDYTEKIIKKYMCKQSIIKRLFTEKKDKDLTFEESIEILDKYMNIFFNDETIKKELNDCMEKL